MTDLPPLPETPYVLASEADGYDREHLLNEEGYSADQMRAYATAAQARQPLTDRQIAKAAMVLNARHAIAFGVNVDDCWKIHGDEFRADAKAALEAAEGAA